jgi:general secretion pathway protein I
MRRQRGFTLLEVLVATTIMGVAVVTIMSALSTSVRNATRLTDYDRVALVARARMDTLLSDPALLPPGALIEAPIDPTSLGGARGGWSAELTPFEPGPDGKPGLDRVQLQIWWMSGDQKRTFNLEAFRRSAAQRP